MTATHTGASASPAGGDNLIQRLRGLDPRMLGDSRKAADRIEALEMENAALRARLAVPEDAALDQLVQDLMSFQLEGSAECGLYPGPPHNPDGPAAADAITALRSSLAEERKRGEAKGFEAALDAANAYLIRMYDISALGHPVDRARIRALSQEQPR